MLHLCFVVRYFPRIDFMLDLIFQRFPQDCIMTMKRFLSIFDKDDGLLFNHVWGKTLRDGSSNLFGIRRHQNPALCPVKAIETYMAMSAELGLDLSHGFLFRPTTPRGTIVNKQVSSSAMQARLQLYLKEASLYEGETLHSFRAGAAITLALSKLWRMWAGALPLQLLKPVFH